MSANLEHLSPTEAADLLKWQLEMGVDCAIMPNSIDRFAVKPAVKRPSNSMEDDTGHTSFKPDIPAQNIAKPIPKKALQEGDREALLKEAQDRAASAKTIDALFDAMDGFQNCPLRRTAMNTVRASGNPNSAIMVITEPPESQEERDGKQGTGAGGALLKKMLAAIELSADRDVYIAPILPWRLLGNKEPDEFELGLCTPFIRRQIEFVQPKLLFLLGKTGAQALLGLHDPISKLRGKWYTVSSGDSAVDTLVSFGPLYLLNRPIAKKESWNDLKSLKKKMLSL